MRIACTIFLREHACWFLSITHASVRNAIATVGLHALRQRIDQDVIVNTVMVN